MSTIYMLVFLAGILLIISYLTNFNWEIKLSDSLILVVFIAFIVRLLATTITDGFPSDIATYKYWANSLYENGFSSFYISDAFTDYPPGYMYILYIVGFAVKTFHITNEYAHTLMIKMPAILFDCLTVGFLFKLAIKKTDKKTAWLISLIYALNPAAVLTSAVWGQTDSVFTFFIFVSVYLLSEKKLMSSYTFFAVSILIKPQALMFSPLYLFSLYEHFKGKGKITFRKAVSFTRNFYPALLVFLCGIIPFTIGFNFTPIIEQYIDTLASYSYATVNAANLYAFLDSNWIDVGKNLLFMPYYGWGAVFITITIIASFSLLYWNNSKANYFFVAAFINVCVFMFCVKMHERYIFPSLILLLAAFVYRREKNTMLAYSGFSLTFFVNTAMILHTYITDSDVLQMAEPLAIVAAFNLGLFIFLIFTARKVCRNAANYQELPIQDKRTYIERYADIKIEKSKEFAPLSSFDLKAMAILTCITALISFANLGDRQAPETLWNPESVNPVIIDLEDSAYVDKFQYYVGISPDKTFYINSSIDGINWEEGPVITTKGVFTWKDVSIGKKAKYIRIIPTNYDLTLFEIGLRDLDGNLIHVTSSLAPELVDEQSVVPENSTYMNSTYFDEIYHARTAYEILNGIKIYEGTHPPLGKAIISIGITLFGMNPFGWRFMGTLFGVFMVPLLYVFGKQIFTGSKWALLAGTLMMFDFMHYTQTRIATIDTYITFFVILMYYFMYRYYCLSFYDTPFKKTLRPLFLSGLCMGLGIACKWPGVYATGGLAVIFFTSLFKRFREYLYAKKFEITEITEAFPALVFKTILCCILFFIIIPVIIYGLSYIPYFNTPGYSNITDIIDNQEYMWNYHSKLVSEHAYASAWWKWPVMIRPIFYYSRTFANGLKAGISAFGNPAIWWLGIIAFFYSIYAAIVKKEKNAYFLIIAYLAQYLPWTLISRTTYIYHYFPSVPFVIFMLTLFFKQFADVKVHGLSAVYKWLVIGLFIMFFPALSGMPAPEWYFDMFLRWMPSWTLIS